MNNVYCDFCSLFVSLLGKVSIDSFPIFRENPLLKVVVALQSEAEDNSNARFLPAVFERNTEKNFLTDLFQTGQESVKCYPKTMFTV